MVHYSCTQSNQCSAVVYSPHQGQSSLLVPVDFDLSFEEVGFFSPYTGACDQSLFDSWLNSEHVELERAVAGETANTGLTMALTQVSAMFVIMPSDLKN